jgi:hypothetical protein
VTDESGSTHSTDNAETNSTSTSTSTNSTERTTDDELRALDIPLLLRYGLTLGGSHRTALFGDGAVAAALSAEDHHVYPRGMAYLGEVVRRGGIAAAAELPEPLPGCAAEPAKEWLATAASVVEDGDVDSDETMARWLEAAATVMELRRGSRGHDEG